VPTERSDVVAQINRWQVADPRVNGMGRKRMDINSVTISDPVSLTKELVELTFWLEMS
jgi:hypothetical protein